MMDLRGVQEALDEAATSVLPKEVDFNIDCELQGPGLSEEIWIPTATREMSHAEQPGCDHFSLSQRH
jgi:hypothetical protein